MFKAISDMARLNSMAKGSTPIQTRGKSRSLSGNGCIIGVNSNKEAFMKGKWFISLVLAFAQS